MCLGDLIAAAQFKMIRAVMAAKEDHVVPAVVVHHAVSTAETLEVAVAAAAATGVPSRRTARAKAGRQAAARRAVNSSTRGASVPATARGARLGHAPPVAA